MKNVQQGYTLIELMIVVAIIGILAAIAIPAYQDYIIRSKVTELVTAADACKVSVAEYAQTNNSLPGDAATAGCNTVAAGNVSSLAVSAGVITVLGTTAIGGGILATDGVKLTPSFDTTTSKPITWACAAAGAMPKKYLPANCRG